jgi:hypothetical protein
LVLAVPSEKLNQSERGRLIFFSAANSDKQILQGWMCPSCETALEVVYPKNDAVKITGETAKAVMAVDPTYDKLPKNLAPDDMKVVTLWLLSPKEVTPEQKGKGVEAARYADLRSKQNTPMASAPPPSETKAVAADEAPKAVDQAAAPSADTKATANTSDAATAPADSSAATSASPASSPVNSSSATPATAPAKAPDTAPGTAGQTIEDHPAVPAPMIVTADTKPAAARSLHSQDEVAGARRMPHTASYTYTFGLIGLVLLGSGAGSYFQRRFFAKSVRAEE